MAAKVVVEEASGMCVVGTVVTLVPTPHAVITRHAQSRPPLCSLRCETFRPQRYLSLPSPYAACSRCWFLVLVQDIRAVSTRAALCASWVKGVGLDKYSVSLATDILFAHERANLQGVLAMQSTNCGPLEQFLRLQPSSSTFHDQVINILHGQEYRRWMESSQDDDVVELVEYLDGVRPVSHLLAPRLIQCRPFMLSTPSVPDSDSVCESLGASVALGRYHRHRWCFHLRP